VESAALIELNNVTETYAPRLAACSGYHQASGWAAVGT
jgi:hypothetical protein